MAESDPTDVEIRSLLQHLQQAGRDGQAWDEIHRYGAEAKFLAYLYPKPEAERCIEEARLALRDRLRTLVDGDAA